MQRYKYLGNWVVAFGTAATLIFGAAILQMYDNVILLAGAALFTNGGREIIKDAEDVKGDVGVKKTIPMILSFEQVKIIVIGVYAIGIFLAILAWINGNVGGPYFIILLLVAAALFFNSWKLLGENKFKAAQQFSKYGMIVSLLAFLGGVI